MMITKPSPSQTRNLTAPCSCVGFHCLNHGHFFFSSCCSLSNFPFFILVWAKKKNWELKYKNLKKEQKKKMIERRKGEKTFLAFILELLLLDIAETYNFILMHTDGYCKSIWFQIIHISCLKQIFVNWGVYLVVNKFICFFWQLCLLIFIILLSISVFCSLW